MAEGIRTPDIGELGLMLKNVLAVHALTDATNSGFPWLAADPFNSRICRVSGAVANSSESGWRIGRIRLTCSAF